MHKLQQKLYRVKAKLKKWNKEVFDNIFSKVELVERKASEKERRYDQDPSDANLIAMNRATTVLSQALGMEEAFWKQKAACKWLAEGERNTKFFHSLVKKKRNQNKIHKIQHNGTILIKENEIQQSGVEFFEQLLACNSDAMVPDDLQWIPNLLNNEDLNFLTACPTMRELKEIVFSISPDSTASPDGFSAHFFQICWELISYDLLEATEDFFKGGQVPRNFTTTTIVLIPKTESPITWKAFRPISLCNVTGKILAKLLNGRLTPLLTRIISPSQSGFIQGRMIVDNILLAQELTLCLEKAGNPNNVILKLDMEKAYDRVHWPFLFKILEKLGFPPHWVQLVKKLIENCWFNIFINGTGVGYAGSETR